MMIMKSLRNGTKSFILYLTSADGNGRTSRLLMNYQLLANGFPAISIAKEKRLEYFNTLEAYAVEGNLAPFAEMVANLTEYQLDCYLEMSGAAQNI